MEIFIELNKKKRNQKTKWFLFKFGRNSRKENNSNHVANVATKIFSGSVILNFIGNKTRHKISIRCTISWRVFRIKLWNVTAAEKYFDNGLNTQGMRMCSLYDESAILFKYWIHVMEKRSRFAIRLGLRQSEYALLWYWLILNQYYWWLMYHRFLPAMQMKLLGVVYPMSAKRLHILIVIYCRSECWSSNLFLAHSTLYMYLTISD